MNSNFKCCKTKPFVHYVCTKCSEVIHKCCIKKSTLGNIRFLKGNKIICCENAEDSLNKTSASDDDKMEIFEKTICELTEETLMKENHIKKLKKDNEIFLREVSTWEEELNELINKKDKTIYELNCYINELKVVINEKSEISKKSVGSQTVINRRKHIYFNVQSTKT